MPKQIQNTNFQRHFNQYETYLTAKGFKGKTFQTPVKEFLIWLEQIGISKIKEVTSKEAKRYYEYLIERPNQRRSGILAGSTIKMHLFALSKFMDNLLSLGEIQKGFIIQKIKGDDKKEREVLSIEEIKQLYRISENLLEQALLSVGYGCGLRRSEMQNLNLSDVQLTTGMLIVRQGKGSKRREVHMSDIVLQSVKRYLTEYRHQFVGKHTENAFFISVKGKRMSGDNLNRKLKMIIERTNQQNLIDKGITLHCLRHSIAHHLMENNAGIDFIRDFLGHSFSNTAYLYARKNREKARIIKTFNT